MPQKNLSGFKNERHSAIEPPIWAGMLANHCRNKNFKVEILDCEVLNLDEIAVLQKKFHHENLELLVLLFTGSNLLLHLKIW